MKKLLFIIAILAATSVTVSAQYKIIVNNSNSVSSLSKTEISKMLLQKTRKWNNGQTVEPVDLTSKSELRKAFTDDVHGKSVNAIKSYWQQYVFAGKGTPPPEKSSDAEVIEYVQSHTGAIGYVSSDTNASGVKVISIN